MSASEEEANRKRHCWECLRRCLVCDSTLPTCNRCSISGISCPGYSDTKPARLRWLAPGRVKSRKERPKKPSSNGNKGASRETTISCTTGLPIREVNVLIPRLVIRTEACAILEAAEYSNTCVYRDLVPVKELRPTPHVYPISSVHLEQVTSIPDHLRLGLVCMTLSHRINQTRNNSQVSTLSTLRESFYQYRGNVIRSLSEELNAEHKRSSDFVIAGIITLLLIDIQQGVSQNWRCHLDGVQRLITLRGGIRALAKFRSLDSLVLTYMLIAVIGNTTSPASDLFMADSQLNDLDFLVEQHGNRTATFQVCPSAIFTEIVRINRLRSRAATRQLTDTNDLSEEGYEALSRIHAFCPEQLAESKPSSREDQMLLGNVYQVTIALYCILSLQSVSILPLTSSLEACRIAHSKHLETLLTEAMLSPRIKRFMLWPLVVLGVNAANDGPAMQEFVAKQMPEMSRFIGSYVPLTAKNVLEKFWTSGETRWDACFDRPYVFATMIAVDTSRMSASS